MMTIRLYNSLTHSVEPLKTLIPNQVKLYVCGVTVYDYCHIGHGRIFVVFDVLVRLLKAVGYQVKYIRNVTDIDDKIIKKAQQLNCSYLKVAEGFTQAMQEDEATLQILPPDVAPKATEHITEIITLIQRLLAQGYAYTVQGEVYFSIERFPSYGEFAHQDLTSLTVGARVEPDERKQHPLDFVLWKRAKAGEPSWDAPWGAGRPGWHIECSAMANKYLGAHFDIHGGGKDLIFPHHQNEIAQSEAANGERLANTWVHVGFVQFNHEKMSKSLGNFFTIREILAKIPAEVLRYFYLTSQYQNPINFSEGNLEQAEAALRTLYLALRGVSLMEEEIWDSSDPFYSRFLTAMADNLNTPLALSILFEIAHEINQNKKKQQDLLAQKNAVTLLKCGRILGILQQDPLVFLQFGVDRTEVEAVVQARVQARKNRDWVTSDRLRKELTDQGIALEDVDVAGTQWYVMNRFWYLKHHGKTET